MEKCKMKKQLGTELKEMASRYPLRIIAIAALLTSLVLTIIGAVIAWGVSEKVGIYVIQAGGMAWFVGWGGVLVAKIATDLKGF